MAAGLLALGIEPGDRVGIWGPNSYEWVMVQLATAKIGAIMVCINPAYRLYELEFALNKVECKVVVTAEAFKTSDYVGMLNTLAPELVASKPGPYRPRNCLTSERSSEWEMPRPPACLILVPSASSAAKRKAVVSKH